MYKVGDKVICVNDIEGIGFDLIKGNIYTICFATHFDDCISLEEIDGIWSISRFKPYNYRKEKLKKILCLK